MKGKGRRKEGKGRDSGEQWRHRKVELGNGPCVCFSHCYGLSHESPDSYIEALVSIQQNVAIQLCLGSAWPSLITHHSLKM